MSKSLDEHSDELQKGDTPSEGVICVQPLILSREWSLYKEVEQ
jgi:hypothetical protein